MKFLVVEPSPLPILIPLAPKRDKIGEWGRNHNEELNSLFISPNVTRVIGSLRWADHVARMEECMSAFKILTGTPTGNIPLGRPRHRWEDNIRIDLKEIDISTRNWVDEPQDRDHWRTLVNVTLNLWVA